MLGLGSYLVARSPGRPRVSQPASRPRYLVQIFLRGGIDAIYTFDPKTRTEVAPGVDVPYSPNSIVDAGPHQFGPHFKQLARWGDRLTIVRGVQVSTANHESGALQMLRMKTGVSRNMPSLLDVAGTARQGQPLAGITLGRTSSLEHSPSGVVAPTTRSNDNIVERLDRLSSSDFDTLAKAYRAHVESVKAWPASHQRKHSLQHLSDVANLFARLADVPKFRKRTTSGQGGDPAKIAEDLERTLWLLEHDLTSGVYLKVFLDWDSHFHNARKQRQASGLFVPMLDQFFESLATRSNEHGLLSDNTLVVIGSELGRFPRLNGNRGKDHFPETGLLFFGAGVVAGQAFGPTSSLLEGRKLNLATGAPDAAGSHLTLNDVGATLLHIMGVEPSRHGYRGRILRFLEAV